MIYCLRCEKQTDTANVSSGVTKNNRHMLRGTCVECGRVKNRFISAKEAARPAVGSERSESETTGGDLVNSLNSVTSNIKLPWARFKGEMHLPGHSFTGPNTRLDLRLNPDGSWKEWSKPVDRIDYAAYKHDLAYAEHQDTENRNKADRAMVEELNRIENPTLRERIERSVVNKIIGTKARFGLGYKFRGTQKYYKNPY